MAATGAMLSVATATTAFMLASTLPWDAARAQSAQPDLNEISTVVVIYAENRSFDNLYGSFPGANGLSEATNTTQLDRDGTPLKELPPVWNGLTAKGVTPAITQAQTEHLPN
ncbi:MAG TPA: alkaline phosphatase family protein, partial [Acetobacteraceae bacterium]|nr:alkaline phosphatase family protein [Acetobacteraceae bacterium]